MMARTMKKDRGRESDTSRYLQTKGSSDTKKVRGWILLMR